MSDIEDVAVRVCIKHSVSFDCEDGGACVVCALDKAESALHKIAALMEKHGFNNERDYLVRDAARRALRKETDGREA